MQTDIYEKKDLCIFQIAFGIMRYRLNERQFCFLINVDKGEGKERVMKEIRLLEKEEIEVRIGSISEKGLSLLLYKDARADMKILDETYGVLGWQRRHEMVGGNLYCTISVWDKEKQQWISKMDVGTESYTEKEKGQASDSFKRACVSLGIGRELYTAPFIWVPADQTVIRQEGNRYVTKDRFKVAEIYYDGRRNISGLKILNQKHQLVFSYGTTPDKTERLPENDGKQHTDDAKIADRNLMNTAQGEKLRAELKRTGVSEQSICARYKVSNLSELSQSLLERALSGLAKTKDAQAA